MSNKITTILFTVVLLGLAAYVYAQVAVSGAGVLPPHTHPVSELEWTDKTSIALIVGVVSGAVLGLFKFWDWYSERRNGTSGEGLAWIVKTMEKLTKDMETLIACYSTDVGRILDRMKSELKVLQDDLDAHDVNMSKVTEFVRTNGTHIDQIMHLLNQLYDLHVKTDNDGIPLVYTPRSWHENQRDILMSLNQIAVNQRDLIEAVGKLTR